MLFVLRSVIKARLSNCPPVYLCVLYALFTVSKNFLVDILLLSLDLSFSSLDTKKKISFPVADKSR